MAPKPRFLEWESKNSFQRGSIFSAVKNGGPEGAWARLERGELSLEEFYQPFAQEVSSINGLDKVKMSSWFNKITQRSRTVNAGKKVWHKAVRLEPNLLNLNTYTLLFYLLPFHSMISNWKWRMYFLRLSLAISPSKKLNRAYKSYG